MPLAVFFGLAKIHAPSRANTEGHHRSVFGSTWRTEVAPTILGRRAGGIEEGLRGRQMPHIYRTRPAPGGKLEAPTQLGRSLADRGGGNRTTRVVASRPVYPKVGVENHASNFPDVTRLFDPIKVGFPGSFLT